MSMVNGRNFLLLLDEQRWGTTPDGGRALLWARGYYSGDDGEHDPNLPGPALFLLEFGAEAAGGGLLPEARRLEIRAGETRAAAVRVAVAFADTCWEQVVAAGVVLDPLPGDGS